ncbi:MAG TPA: hypothetical protein VK509_16950 [Polyangiales bacterium]|nr:hypothetical protein [Polyangiales bacterium]
MRMRSWGARAASFLAWLLVIGALCAQADDASAQTQARGYEQLIADAIVEYNAGNWAEARLLFQRAHAIRPSARTFRGMGLADYEQRSYVAAIRELSAALASSDKPLSAQQRQSAELALAKAREYVAIYTLRVPAQARELLVNGRSSELPGNGKLELDPGRYVVSVEVQGRVIERELVAEAGARGELRFEPADAEATPATAAPHAPSGPSPVSAQSPARDGGLAWTWVAGGATVLFGAGTVTFGLLAIAEHDDFSELDEACPGAQCDAEARAAASSQGQDFQLLTNVGIALTSAAAVTTVVLFAVESGGESEAATTRLSLRPGSVALEGRF